LHKRDGWFGVITTTLNPPHGLCALLCSNKVLMFALFKPTWQMMHNASA
jgi:hypothetical protein